MSELHREAESGGLAGVRALIALSKGSMHLSLDLLDINGQSALYLACLNGHVEVPCVFSACRACAG